MIFSLFATNGFIKIGIPEKQPFDTQGSRDDDYYADFKIELQVESMNLKSRYYGSIEQLIELRTKLQNFYDTLKGDFRFINYPESNIELQFTMAENGHLLISGKFWEIGEKQLSVEFGLNSDQSYLPDAISSLTKLITEMKQ